MQDKIVILVSGILTNQKNEVLLLRRSKVNSSYKGCWQLPEGKMEFGEAPEDTIRRELKEETKLTTKKLKLLFVATTLMHVRGQDYHVVRIVYKVNFAGTIVLDREHDEFKWFDYKNSKMIEPIIDGLAEIFDLLN